MVKPLTKKQNFYDNSLEIKSSEIPGAGVGVFTQKYIEKDSIITEFTGEKISHTIGLSRIILKTSHSILYLNKKYCVDSKKDECCIATYINDAKGFIKISGLRNNVSLVIAKGRLLVVAKRNIKAGEELYMNYGINYWRTVIKYQKICL